MTDDIVPPDSEKSRETVQVEYEVRFEGAIPHPSILAGWERTLPGAADRILSMAEKEQAHRHSMQSRVVEAQSNDMRMARSERKLGQVLGLVIGIFAIVTGGVTAIMGSPIAGGLIGSSGVAGLVSVFVLGRNKSQDSSSESRFISQGLDEDEEDY